MRAPSLSHAHRIVSQMPVPSNTCTADEWQVVLLAPRSAPPGALDPVRLVVEQRLVALAAATTLPVGYVLQVRPQAGSDL